MGIRGAIAAGLVLALLGLSAPQPQPPLPAPGYHHLGATTGGEWSGVLGRLAVGDPVVRADSFDFVATRFMAKATTPLGVKWLEAGWAATGWAGAGEERIYTFDTNTLKWTFYDQYPIRPGDQVWIELVATGTGDTAPWQAWLWWHGGWHLLTTQSLPISQHATIEEYVEVYVDPARGGTLSVPPVEVDNVQLRPDPAAPFRYWTDGIDTAPGGDADGYCVDFTVPYDTWHAGNC